MINFNCHSGDKEYDYFIKHSKLVPVISKKTYPSYESLNGFDQIFISKDIKVLDFGLVKEKLSDHIGIYAKLIV